MGAKDSIRGVIQKDAPMVKAQDTVQLAVQRMVEAGSTALAVESGDELIGVLSDMDIMLCIEKGKDLAKEQVMTWMTACDLIAGQGPKSPCVQLDEEETVEMALKIMAEAGVHNLLVTGRGSKPVGLVSSHDLLAAYIA